MSGGPLITGSRSTSSFFAALAGAPLALWFGAAMLGTPSPQPPTSPAPSAEAPPAAQAAGSTSPPEYCVRRFLAPIQAMAGIAPSTSSSAPKPATWKITGPLSGPTAEGPTTFEASVVPAASEARDWMERIGDASAQLRAVFASHDGSRASITTTIATIPDPIDSGLSYAFETALESLRRGIEHPLETESFYRDRIWLPWTDLEAEPKDVKESERCRLSTPGIMLFRNGTVGHHHLHALLLVGESPTTGLRQATMLNALRLAAELEGARATNAVRVVRVVGPTFSGSALSLRLSLRSWAAEQAEPIAFEVHSGTATGSDVPQILRAQTRTPQTTLSYFATTLSESTLECAYLWYLKQQLGIDADSGRPGHLAGTATLSEAGTEFGGTLAANSASASPQCRWVPSSALSFPFHISALRDAYEDLDRRDGQERKDSTIARVTNLGLSLHEPRIPAEIESNPSPRTQAAQDVMLSNVLGQISGRNIRHLAIHATDVGDAIFLARKIRDVAPDVRLAFFDSDSLLLHSEYRRDLVGSIVVGAYPFLGVSPFSTDTTKSPLPRLLSGFENGGAQGLYNAVLSQRTNSLREFSNYTLSNDPLPVWISAIGRGSFEPLRVGPSADCDNAVFGTRTPNPAHELCTARAGSQREAWEKFNRLKVSELGLSRDLTTPRVWDLLFVIVLLAFVIDQTRQSSQRARIARDSVTRDIGATDDRTLDRVLGRTKWLLYATIRTFLFALCFIYIGVLNLLSFVARGGFSRILDHDDGWALAWHLSFFVAAALAVCSAIGVSVALTAHAARRFGEDYGVLGRLLGQPLVPHSVRHLRDGVRSSKRQPKVPARARSAPSARRRKANPTDSTPPSQRGFLDRLSSGLGFRRPMGRLDVAKTSFAQLRLITVVTAMLALAFSGLLLAETWLSTDWLESGWGSIAVPALTLTVLRNTTLVNGVAPSTPALLCMLCVYGWAVGRMARLSLAHATSRIAPKDGETDLVSTPIQLVLHPGYEGCTESDEGFTEVERDVHNSIWRPITGRYYVAASCALGLFPLVLFTMKPLSTLEGFCGTYLLAGGLGLAVFLIGVTLIQLAQYWTTLERLLKRTMQHPIGSAFATVPHFARDSVDHQISRSPNELLRWSACAQLYSDLVVTSERIEDCVGVASCRAWLRQSQRDLHRLRRGALGSKTKQRGVTLELALVQKVILTASSVTAILERAWDRSERQQLATLATAAIQTDAAVPAAHRAAVGAEWNLVSVTLAVPANPQSKNPANEALTTTTVTRSSAPPSGPRHAQPEAPNATAPRETDDAHDDALSPVAHRFTAAQLRWLRSAQTFVATVVTLLIHRHVRQFRYFLSVTTGCSLLLLLAVASYPFEPYRLILTFIWVIVASVVAMGFWVFIRMDRNTLMSHISGTSPNEVTWNAAFVLRVVAWAIVPLLGIAATQYPQLANVLFSVLGPVTRALR